MVQLDPNWFLFPMPAALIGAQVEGKPNFMTAAHVGVVNHDPPTLSVGLRPARYTLLGVEANEAFSVCLPSTALLKETDYCGLVSGHKTDKSQVFKTFFGQLKTAPLIEECPVNLECKLIKTLEFKTHRICFGQVVGCHVQEGCLTDGKLDMGKIDPIVYSMSDATYWQVGQPVGKAFQEGKALKAKQG
ncbi:MAG: flavin reductase family protein [Deltaproteobacteria bacterium]|nr:flavin reductase family protein [Deltaproteobacteria bacterium]